MAMVSIDIPDEELKRLDAAAKRQDRTRASAIRVAARQWVEKIERFEGSIPRIAEAPEA